MGILIKKNFKKGDSAVLYVTTCSDIESSFAHSRRFLECQIVGKIHSTDKEQTDDRYIVRCAEDLREEPYKGGIYAYEALVSVHSPFLMTWEEFEMLRTDPKALNKWLKVVEDLISGFKIPKAMRNWQYELMKIVLGLGIDDTDEVFSDIKEDFVPSGMEVIRFPL